MNADRTALFLLDRKTDEIYARVFDRGHEEQLEVTAGSDASPTKHPNEIRFD